MSDLDSEEDNYISVENDTKKRNISLKNIKPLNGIKVIRDDESDSLSDSSSISEKVKVKKTKKILRRKETPSFQQPQSYRDYSAFSNPKKTTNKQEEMSDQDSVYSDESASVYSDESGEAPQQNKQRPSFEEQQKLKQDLLIKIQALEKKGFEFSKKFNMTSNYDEMFFEFQKIKKFIETQSAIKFSRRCLMACVTGVEFLNKRFDPFHIKLEGWSENVMENVEDYDNVFEKLYEKYKGKSEIAPEIELMLMLGGSAFMYHLTNTLLRGPTMPGLVAQNNPNFMASVMGAMSQGMKEMNKPPNLSGMYEQHRQQQQQQTFPKPVETRGARQEMRGPTIDHNLFNGTPLASNHPDAHNFHKPEIIPTKLPVYDNSPIDDDDRFSIASSDSSLSTQSTVKNVIVKKNGKKSGGLELNIN